MKLAIVVGHNETSQGAVRTDTHETEFHYNSDLAERIKDVLSDYDGYVDGKVFYRVLGGGYSEEIARVYNEVNDWGATASIELHFNSAGDPRASGTETFSSGSAKSLILAEEVQMEMVEALGLRDRGIKIRNSRTKGRGYLSLVSGNAPAILIEPFFGSSSIGQRATDDDHERRSLAEAIAEGAVKAMKRF